MLTKEKIINKLEKQIKLDPEGADKITLGVILGLCLVLEWDCSYNIESNRLEITVGSDVLYEVKKKEI